MNLRKEGKVPVPPPADETLAATRAAKHADSDKKEKPKARKEARDIGSRSVGPKESIGENCQAKCYRTEARKYRDPKYPEPTILSPLQLVPAHNSILAGVDVGRELVIDLRA